MGKKYTLSKKQKTEFSYGDEKELAMLHEKAKKLRELQSSLKSEFPGEPQIDIDVSINMIVKQIGALEKTKIEAQFKPEI